jgi:uncharacterized protein YkwD
MRTRLLLVFTMAFAMAAILSSLPASGEETREADFRSQVERETFALINQYWDSSIAQEARIHSKDMATHEVDFGHDGFRQRVGRLRNVMAGFQGAGENVFMASNPEHIAQRAVTTWLHSPHHLENIRGDYNYSGLGIWQNESGAIYFTQIFIKFEPALQEADKEVAPEMITTFGLIARPRTRVGP